MADEEPEGFSYKVIRDADTRNTIQLMALKDGGFAIAWALLEIASAIREHLSDVTYEVDESGEMDEGAFQRLNPERKP